MAFVAAGALALAACGGDDEGNGATTGATAEDTTTATTDTTTTGTTKRQRTGTTREDRTTTRERGDDSGGGDRSGSGGGGSGGGSQGSDDSGSTSEPAAQPGNVRRVARTVCNSFLPEQIQRDLEQDDRSPEDVARDYSRGFPKRQQKDAYEGCLAGLKAR